MTDVSNIEEPVFRWRGKERVVALDFPSLPTWVRQLPAPRIV